jgi:hypothetical protein
MPAGQNHSNFALNTRLSAPRYDIWCKIQVLNLQSLEQPPWEREMDGSMFGLQTGFGYYHNQWVFPSRNVYPDFPCKVAKAHHLTLRE